MKGIIATPYITEQKGKHTLVLWPEKPTWLLLNEDGFELFQLLSDSASFDGFLNDAHQKGFQRKDVLEFVNELKQRKCFQQKPKKGQLPSHNLVDIWLSITRSCNLRCLHCDVNAGNDTEPPLTPQEVYEIVTEALTLTMKNELLLALTGGEPLMRRDFLDIVELLSQNRKIRIQIITNGTLLNQHIAETLSYHLKSMHLKGLVL